MTQIGEPSRRAQRRAERALAHQTAKQDKQAAYDDLTEAKQTLRARRKDYRGAKRRLRRFMLRRLAWAAGVLVALFVIGNVLNNPPADTNIGQQAAATTSTTARPTTTIGSATTRPRPATTTTAAPTALGLAEECFSGWSGNHRGFVDKVKAVLNDPGSMEVHGTYFNSNDSPADGIRIRMDYSAANAYGGMVRGNALADMRLDCSISVIQYE